MTPPLKIPHCAVSERYVVSALVENQTLRTDPAVMALEVADFLDHTAADVFAAYRTIEARGEIPTTADVLAMIEARTVERTGHTTGSKHHPDVDALISLAVERPPARVAVHRMIRKVQADAAERREMLAAATEAERAQHEHEAARLDEMAGIPITYEGKSPASVSAGDLTPPDDDVPHAAECPANPDAGQVSTRVAAGIDKRPPRWRRARDLVDGIIQSAAEPSIALKLGDEEIVLVRPGGIVELIGASGAGKTSLAAGFLVEHAHFVGPAIAMSLELPGEEFTGRVVGMRTDTGWLDVLIGQVPREHMIAALPERLVVIARADASTGALREAIEAMRAAYPGEAIVCAIDYVQLMTESTEREIRRRIADAMASIDSIARELRVAVIALSQGSRVSARALSSGTALGAETTDAGAEAAELERWSTATLAIGPHKLAEDKSHAFVDLSLGKYRMGVGDRVRPMRYEGKSGRWRAAGEWRAAADVRAEAKLAGDEQKRTALENQLIGAAMRSPKPLSVEALCKTVKGNNADKRAAVRDLLTRGDLVQVMQRAPRSRAWLIWAPANATAEGISLAPDGDDDV